MAWTRPRSGLGSWVPPRRSGGHERDSAFVLCVLSSAFLRSEDPVTTRSGSTASATIDPGIAQGHRLLCVCGRSLVSVSCSPRIHCQFGAQILHRSFCWRRSPLLLWSRFCSRRCTCLRLLLAGAWFGETRQGCCGELALHFLARPGRPLAGAGGILPSLQIFGAWMGLWWWRRAQLLLRAGLAAREPVAEAILRSGRPAQYGSVSTLRSCTSPCCSLPHGCRASCHPTASPCPCLRRQEVLAEHVGPSPPFAQAGAMPCLADLYAGQLGRCPHGCCTESACL